MLPDFLNLTLNGSTVADNGSENINLLGTGSPTVGINGTTGDDTLISSNVDDTMTGDTGSDIFAFAVNSGADIITDFIVDDDQLDVSALGITALGQMTFNGEVVDFNGANDEQVTLTGVVANSLDASSFIFA